MSKRKTISIEALKAKANNVFLASTNEYAEGRKHIQTFVDSLLMEAGQYKGFGYLTRQDVAPGQTFGIEWDGKADTKPIFHDQTRVRFY